MSALRGLPASVASSGEAHVFGELDEFDFRVGLGDESLRAIGGTVVYEQDFKICDGLLAQGLEAGFQVLFSV